MEIQELLIRKYGKFSDYRMTFQPGINIIFGGNETGKSTIHSFIKAMLFGLNRGRGRAARMDEYQLRQPWDSPGAFLGSMRIRENGEIYRIDRCFDRSGKPLGLVCETKHLESQHPQEKLDALLCGISENAFMNSVFIPQMHCETDEAFAQELRRYMINSENSMDSEIDVTRALQSLRKKKKQLEQQQKKEEEELEKKIAQKQEKTDLLRRELDLLEQQAAYHGGGSTDVRTRNEGGTAARGSGRRSHPNQSGPEEEEQSGGTVSPWMRRILCAMLLIAGALTLDGAILTEGTSLRIFLGVMTALFWAMAIGVHALFAPSARIADGTDWSGQPPVSESDAGYLAELQKEIRNRREAYRKLQEELELLYRQHVSTGQYSASGSNAGTYPASGSSAGVYPALETNTGCAMEIEALTMAIDRICDLSDQICRESGGRLNEIASEILEEITCGRYNRIVMDDAGEVRIHTPSRVLALNQVSSGTMQQIYFALRMAAGELFMESRSMQNRANARCSGLHPASEGDAGYVMESRSMQNRANAPIHASLPVILDEPFAMYDDHRLEATLRWLKKSGRQVILFTCQSREREILKRINE